MAFYNRAYDDGWSDDYLEDEKHVPFAYFNSQERKIIHQTNVGRYEEETLPYCVNIAFRGSTVEMTLNVDEYEFVVLAKEVTDYIPVEGEGGVVDNDFEVDTLELKSVSVTYAKDTDNAKSFTDSSLDDIADALALVFGFEDGRTSALLREMFEQLVDWYDSCHGDDDFDIKCLADAVQALDDAMVENLEHRNVDMEEIPVDNSDSEEEVIVSAAAAA